MSAHAAATGVTGEVSVGADSEADARLAGRVARPSALPGAISIRRPSQSSSARMGPAAVQRPRLLHPASVGFRAGHYARSC